MAVKSAERVLKIFELLEREAGGLTNKEVSEALNFAPSSTLGLLQTMTEKGYLFVDGQKKYHLGGKLLFLGATVASRFDISKMAAPYLKHLVSVLNETSFLGVLSEGEIVYIAQENCERSIRTNANIGSRKPVYCTGLGKAYLSFLPEEESMRILEQIQLEAYTKNTVRSVEELKKQMNEFRQQGFAVDNEEIEEGLWCMAVPIYNGYGRIVAAISVSGPRERMLEKKELLKKEMLEVKRRLSGDLGYYKEDN